MNIIRIPGPGDEATWSPCSGHPLDPRSTDDRSAEVDLYNEQILNDHELLSDAIGDFGNANSYTTLDILLQDLANCDSDTDMLRVAGSLQQHLRSIAMWAAEGKADRSPMITFDEDAS